MFETCQKHSLQSRQNLLHQTIPCLDKPVKRVNTWTTSLVPRFCASSESYDCFSVFMSSFDAAWDNVY